MPHVQVRMPGHDRNRSLGYLAIAWMENLCRHGFGSVRGQRMIFDQDFYALTLDVYTLDTNGRRLYDTCVVSRAKGTAKSEWAGNVVLFDSMGPSRFAGWATGGETFEQFGFTYTYIKGEPMGRRLQDPFVRLLATEEGQTGNTFRNVRSNLEDASAPLSAVPGVDSGITRAIIPNGGEIRPSTSGAASKDGGLETMAVADETHLYNQPELRGMYDTVDQNLPKRKADEPWMLATTTMYGDGEDSIAERQHKLAKAIMEGKVSNPRFLFDHIEAGTITNLGDTEQLRAALHESYSNREWIDYDRYIARAQDPTKSPERFRRLNLNQQSASATAFVTSQQLAAIGELDGELIAPLKKGETITLGFDYAPGNLVERAEGSKKLLRVPDATALVACRLKDMTLHPIGIWEATEHAAMLGWNPPMVEIEATFHDTMAKFNVVGVFADPSGVEGYLDRWTSRYLKKLKVVASRGRPMYFYMSGKSATTSGKAVESLYEAIASEQVHMVASAQLIRHFLNARRVTNRWGLALYKRTSDSPEKIDGAVASVLAYAAAVQALNKGIGTATTTRRRAPRVIN
jgi:phage terminase large subunit-like protein